MLRWSFGGTTHQEHGSRESSCASLLACNRCLHGLVSFFFHAAAGCRPSGQRRHISRGCSTSSFFFSRGNRLQAAGLLGSGTSVEAQAIRPGEAALRLMVAWYCSYILCMLLFMQHFRSILIQKIVVERIHTEPIVPFYSCERFMPRKAYMLDQRPVRLTTMSMQCRSVTGRFVPLA